MSAFEASVLRILKDDATVGAAFLVSDRLIVTCVHVVKAAGGAPGRTVRLRLSDGSIITAEALSEYWREESRGDIAILRLEKPILGVQPLVLGSSAGTQGHTFSTFGFPRKGQELAGRGEIIGFAVLGETKLLQLDS